MANDPIVVSAVGMVSPVGHSAAVTFASVKAGLARIAESPELRIRDDRGKLMTVTCAAVTGITDGHRRYLRLFRLAVRALSQTLKSAALDHVDLDRATMHLVLAEPGRPGMDHRVEQDLARKMLLALGLEAPLHTIVTTEGHAGIFEALGSAMSSIASGSTDRAIVGAVDGYLDELTLQWLKDTERLKSEDNPKGFVPGEAAGFLMLERQSAVAARGGRGLARLAGTGYALESHSIYDKTPSTGAGLTGAIRSALTASGEEPPLSLVVCDLNGERYRANEWGLVLSRAFESNQAPESLWHPADCVGDCGAAAGILNTVVATLAVAQDRSRNDSALVWGASDDGQRGAAMLSAA
jgi:3-oxoacyl-[acyl-carrier-protein] synthase-1